MNRRTVPIVGALATAALLISVAGGIAPLLTFEGDDCRGSTA